LANIYTTGIFKQVSSRELTLYLTKFFKMFTLKTTIMSKCCAAGSSVDWAYEDAGIKYSFALEVRDDGKWGFLLPQVQLAIQKYIENFQDSFRVSEYNIGF
jgi:hypothetical protein